LVSHVDKSVKKAPFILIKLADLNTRFVRWNVFPACEEPLTSVIGRGPVTPQSPLTGHHGITVPVMAKVTAWGVGIQRAARWRDRRSAGKLLTCAGTIAAQRDTRSIGRLGHTIMTRCRVEPSPRHLKENVALLISLGNARPTETLARVFAKFFG
jgi:hypothetical protein